MGHYGTQDVIGEESDCYKNDMDRFGMVVRYNSDDYNVSARIDDKNMSCTGDTNNLEEKRKKKKSTDWSMNSPYSILSDSDRRRSVVDRQGSMTKRNRITFEPTYRLEPKPNQYFLWYKVRNTLDKVIEPLFENLTYNSRTAGSYCKMICSKALAMIKRKFEWPRYRYVCHVTLIQLKDQGIVVGDRSLMLPGFDSYAVCVFQNKEAALILTFHGVYTE